MALSNITGTVAAHLDVNVIDDNYNAPNVKVNQSANQAVAFGGGSGQVNKIYSVQSTISSSSTLSIDLDAGTLTDIYGNALTFTAIKAIRVHHKGTSAASTVSIAGDFMTTVFGASFNHSLAAGGLYLTSNLASDYTVVASTGDVIEIINNDGSNSATVSVDILGD